MTTSQTDVKSQIIELSTKAFETFCEDISGMFDVSMQCTQQESCTETVKGLKKRFKKLVAVNSIKSEGALDGNFQIVFDKEGLFTLAGVVVTLPEQQVLDNIKQSSTKEAEDMSDAVGEAGNMLVASWDKVFLKGLEGHGHFTQTNTFIGNPWGNPGEKIGLAKDEEFLFVSYEMTIESYPAFNCGIIFPKTIFGETPVSDAEPATSEGEKVQEEAKDKQYAVEKADSKEAAEAEAEQQTSDENQAEAKEPVAEGTAEAETKQEAPDENQAEAEEPVAEESAEAETERESSDENPTEAEEPVAKKTVEAKTEQEAPDENQAEAEEPVAEESAGDRAENEQKTADENQAEAETEPEEISESAEPTAVVEPAAGPVSETIQRMTGSSADLPSGIDLASSEMCAKDIMQKEVLWGNVDDSVQQALTKMQQADAGYMMVGTEGSLEGIVSTFDIAAALSVYLKPMFAKWRRPIDDATLQIKIKWIMTRPVHTINPDASLTVIMENMRQSGLHCLPVADQQGKIAGLVTAFDIFEALLNASSDISTKGKTPQAPSLV